MRDVLDAARGKRRPAGLMRGANAATVITVEILVEQDEVFPIWIVHVPGFGAVAWPATVPIWYEDAGQPARELVGDLL